MIIYPAIDLRGGRCVRLVQGDPQAETVVSDDPVLKLSSATIPSAPPSVG
jgi:phosphoribosylformimino-5-aminoimidazole carboxamide ribonucleotide (ProFAR) isomerase